MKFFAGIICALLLAVLGTLDAKAQNYCVENNTLNPISTVCIRISCGPPICSPPVIASGGVWCTPIPANCTVLGIVYNNTFYPVGYSGPTLTVTATTATFM